LSSSEGELGSNLNKRQLRFKPRVKKRRRKNELFSLSLLLPVVSSCVTQEVKRKERYSRGRQRAAAKERADQLLEEARELAAAAGSGGCLPPPPSRSNRKRPPKKKRKPRLVGSELLRDGDSSDDNRTALKMVAAQSDVEREREIKRERAQMKASPRERES
jgi:hypothetical protein